MSTKNYYNFGIINYDNHKEVTINGAGANVSDIVRSFFAEDVEPVENVKSAKKDYFPYLTQKCFDDHREDAVEAEIKAACKGTAETLWRTLWDNENLGYVETKNLEASTIYREVEKRYGKLPYKERNFRDARTKR